ncbi:BON domain-containing protein [Paraburkholderia pallida]|uniref:BON domain-containing protein n=1 Tax=Paraburkholderia pallida TaxID=2547399 RepID=A0A4P7D4R3_9BURK|nr:BON domain-containing protein [Paraburkholderia pallida]QBR03756.1 BON domain-containing protein [Paraburkholderia pallida]
MRLFAYVLIASSVALAVAHGSATAQPASEPQASSAQGNAYKQFRHSSAADKAFAKSVWKHVAHIKGLELGDVAIMAKNGDVLITGRVSNSEQIAKIGAAVQETPGVHTIVNNLVVWPVRPN